MSIATRLEVSDGRYRVRWVDPKTKRRRTRNIGRIDEIGKKAAERMRRQIEHELNDDPAAASADPSMTVEKWAERYFEFRAVELDDRTVVLQKHAVELFVKSIGPRRRLESITREDAAMHRRLLGERSYQGKVIGPATIAKHIRALRAIFGSRYGAVRYGAIRFNPFDSERGLNPAIDDEVRYVTLEELDRVLADDRSHTAIALAIARLAGLRPGEIARLQWRDVDFVHGRIHVRHTGQQTTKKRARTVPMSPRLRDVLQAHHDAAPAKQKAVVELPEHNLYNKIRQIVTMAGVEPWGSPIKTLRKNIETDWMAEHPIMDVCKWLGHSPAVAQVHYHKARPEVMDRVSNPAASGKPSAKELAKMIDESDPAEWLPLVRAKTAKRVSDQLALNLP